MIIKSIKTHPILPFKESLLDILAQYIVSLPEKSILVVASKIVALCEGRVVKIQKAQKPALVKKEAEFYLPPETNFYGISLTIKGNLLTANAGIDESNGAGYFILWPHDPQASANQIRHFLKKRFQRKKLGVIITDSKTTPLRWGVTGIALAHSGFRALNDYIGQPDIFGRDFKVTKVNVMDGLAAAAALAMGEGNEQTPLAIIRDTSFVHFTTADPSQKELKDLSISLNKDMYGVLLKSRFWKKGGSLSTQGKLFSQKPPSFNLG